MAEKRTIELEIQDNSKTLKQQYKEAVIELQKVAAAYGETSQQAAEAAKKAAGLKDRIEDTNDAIKAFKGEGAFNALGKSVSSVASGFSAVEGAMGLVGVESEKLQETMLRVQSAMALAQGLEGLEDAGRAFKQLGSVAINALKGIKGALAATGIGLFVVALGTVVAYWDDIKEAVSGVSDEQTKLNEKTSANLEASEAKVSALDKQDNILKLQGKSEKEILQLKITELDATIKIAETNLENQKATKKAQVEAAKRNRDILVGIIDFIAKPLEMLLKGVDKVAEYLGQDSGLAKWFEGAKTSAAELIFDPKETASEGDKAIKAAEEKLTELKNQQAGYKLQIKQINQEASKSSVDIAKDEQDKKLQAEKEYNDKLRAYYDAIEAERQSKITDAQEKELQEVANKYEKLYELADAAGQSDKELIKKQEEETAAIKTKYDLLAQEESKKTADELAKIEKEKLDEIEKANKEAAEKDAALKKRNKEFGIEMALSGLSTISSLTELFGKKSEKQAKRAFQVQKAAQVASALINTYQSATGAYASQFLPVPDPTSPVRGGIAAGLAVAAGLVNVAKIASQKFEGGSQGGGGGAPSGSIPDAQMAAPQFQTIGTSGVNQLATLQQQPTKAYVVSGEVTSAQSLDRNRVQNATL
jgi:hypothetical protein